MLSSLRFRLCTLAFISFGLFSCTDTKEEFITEPLTDYLPLQPGKYITYRLDSVVTIEFQRKLDTNSYQVKHVVDALVTDNAGRPAYRIYRYLNDATASGQWVANGSYFITVSSDQVEVSEDNLRFIKLHAPLKEGFTWDGNSYLTDDPYKSIGYNFSLSRYMEGWDYWYDAFQSTFTYKGIDYTDVHTVEQQDDATNIPVTFPDGSGNKQRGREVYAKNIGLVFKEFTLLEYEPNTSGPSPYYTGFGITMWMVDHN
jgi:hypothetical protein